MGPLHAQWHQLFALETKKLQVLSYEIDSRLHFQLGPANNTSVLKKSDVSSPTAPHAIWRLTGLSRGVK